MKFNVGDRVDYVNWLGYPNNTPGTIIAQLGDDHAVMWDDGFQSGVSWRTRELCRIDPDFGYVEFYADKILEALK